MPHVSIQMPYVILYFEDQPSQGPDIKGWGDPRDSKGWPLPFLIPHRTCHQSKHD